MSLVHNPEILARIKVLNMREEERLKRKLVELDQNKQYRLHTLKLEKQELVKELRASKMREMRENARQSLKLQDKLALELEATRGKANAKRTQLRIVPDFEATRGFSKVDVQDDEDDIFARAAKLQKSQTTPDMRRLLSREKEKEGEDKNTEESSEDTNEDILVYRPTEVGERVRRKTICVVPVRATLLSRQFSGRHVNERNPVVSPREVAFLKRSISQPSYVNLLERMENRSFTQHTDGSMALSMRRFRQRQRERIAPLPGHLAVRKRPILKSKSESSLSTLSSSKAAKETLSSSDLSDLREEEENEEGNRANKLPNVQGLGLLNPTTVKLRFHIPKSARVDREQELNEENKRIWRIRRAEQAGSYEAALRSTSAFLGRRPSSVDLIQKVSLSREETFLLDKLRRSASTSDLLRQTPGSNNS